MSPRDQRSRESYSEFGIVLSSRTLGESDVILTLLLGRRGKIAARVRGLKKSKKRFMGGLDLFDTAHFTIEERGGGQEKISTLVGIKEKRSFPGLGTNLRAFMVGSLGLELVSYLALERDPEGGLYLRPLIECLFRLEQHESSAKEEAAKLLFKILTTAGFSDFENLSAKNPEVAAWNRSNFLSDLRPSSETLSKLIIELLHSVEVILGRRLSTRDSIERILLA